MAMAADTDTDTGNGNGNGTSRPRGDTDNHKPSSRDTYITYIHTHRGRDTVCVCVCICNYPDSHARVCCTPCHRRCWGRGYCMWVPTHSMHLFSWTHTELRVGRPRHTGRRRCMAKFTSPFNRSEIKIACLATPSTKRNWLQKLIENDQTTSRLTTICTFCQWHPNQETPKHGQRVPNQRTSYIYHRHYRSP